MLVFNNLVTLFGSLCYIVYLADAMFKPTSYNSSRFAPHNPSRNDFSPLLDENIAYHAHTRVASANTCLSAGSVIRRPPREALRVRDANTRTLSISLSTLDNGDGSRNVSQPKKPSTYISRPSSQVTDINSSQKLGETLTSRERTGGLGSFNLTAGSDIIKQRSGSTSSEGKPDAFPSLVLLSIDLLEGTKIGQDSKSHPFRRWVSIIRRRNVSRRQVLGSNHQRFALDDFETGFFTPSALLRSDPHRKSSSSGFITAMKSVTASLITSSVAPQSRVACCSSMIRPSNGSSGISTRFNRSSLDYRHLQVDIIDEDAKQRALQRREIIDEIISSEENYVADLKVLVNVSSIHLNVLMVQPTKSNIGIFHFAGHGTCCGP